MLASHHITDRRALKARQGSLLENRGERTALTPHGTRADLRGIAERGENATGLCSKRVLECRTLTTPGEGPNPGKAKTKTTSVAPEQISTQAEK